MERLTENVSGCNQIIKCGNDLCKETCEEWSCDFCPISEAIDKLAEYEDAEEQGLLLRLPCKVGDTVYQLDDDCEDGIYETKVLSFMFDKDGIAMKTISTFPMVSEFGKTVFLTKEEAEQALAERKNVYRR